MMSARERHLAELEARAAALRAAPSVLDLEARRLESEARKRLEDLRGLLARNPAEARRVLEATLAGPLLFHPEETPEGRRYRITGQASVDSMTGVPSGDRTERISGSAAVFGHLERSLFRARLGVVA